MTLEELEELRDRAQKQCGHRITVQLTSEATWTVFHHGTIGHKDERNLAESGMITKLRMLATPPKPPNIQITIPTDCAEHYVKHGFAPDHSATISNACREALKPYQQ